MHDGGAGRRVRPFSIMDMQPGVGKIPDATGGGRDSSCAANIDAADRRTFAAT